MQHTLTHSSEKVIFSREIKFMHNEVNEPSLFPHLTRVARFPALKRRWHIFPRLTGLYVPAARFSALYTATQSRKLVENTYSQVSQITIHYEFVTKCLKNMHWFLKPQFQENIKMKAKQNYF